MNTTTTQNASDHTPLTLDDMVQATKSLGSMKRTYIEVSKKDYKRLKSLLGYDPSPMRSLRGIPVYIRPYLKKIRIYTEV